MALGLYELAARIQYSAFREREKRRELWCGRWHAPPRTAWPQAALTSPPRPGTRELNNFPEGEKREMVDIWRSKGLRERDARALINIMCRYETFFVDIMMTEELGFGPENEEDTPLRSGACRAVPPPARSPARHQARLTRRLCAATWTGGAALAFSCAPWALQALVAPADAAPAASVLALLAAQGGLVAWLHARLFNLATWQAAAYVAGVVAGAATAARLASAAL